MNHTRGSALHRAAPVSSRRELASKVRDLQRPCFGRCLPFGLCCFDLGSARRYSAASSSWMGSSRPRDQDMAVNFERAQPAGIKPVLVTLNLVASSTWINAAPAYLANTRAGGGEQHQ